MSLTSLRHAYDHVNIAGSALLVLITVAYHADHEVISFPSVKTLARETRLSVRQVQRLLRLLETQHALVCHRRAGKNGTNIYRVLPTCTTVPYDTAMTSSGDTAMSYELPLTYKEVANSNASLEKGLRLLTEGSEAYNTARRNGKRG
jgi:hypothetical protein